MSWLIASPQPDLGPRLYVAIDAADKPCWTDSKSLAHRFDTRERAEAYGEAIDMGEPLEAVSLNDEMDTLHA